MPNINLATVLNSAGGAGLVEQKLDKEFLARVTFDGVLANNKAYALSKPLPQNDGQYFKFTRKQHIRLPETDPFTNSASSDPASGISLGTDIVLLPIEAHRDYADIDILADQTSWIDLMEWVKNDLPLAWKRRMHRLVQNAFLNGRMAPGVYAADGTISTAFDNTAEASITRFGIAFTFTAAPRSFGNGKGAFNQLDGGDTMTWADVARVKTALSLSRAPKIKGNKGPGYMCVLSESMWEDLRRDTDGGRITAAISGGWQAGIKSLEDCQTFFYNGVYFVIDDDPYTLNSASAVARAEWGEIHAALFFGNEAYGMTSLGKKGMRNFKVQDISKTGSNYTIGTRTHWNCRIVNQDWCHTVLAPVSYSKPNNYSATNKQLHGADLA